MARRARGGLPDVEDVLDGRVTADWPTLVHLIHSVNPTARGLPAEVERARYALKARLQSLLVRRFSDRMEAVRDPLSAGAVSLRVRGGPDAGHTKVEELEADARSWVVLQLDLAEAPAPAPVAAPVVEVAPLSMLARGQQALAAYDFDEARRCFALALGQGDAEAGRALVELLVDHLADDSAALALTLPAAAREHPEVRLLLGLAAARTGQRGRAASLLDGVVDPRAADGWVLLCRAAIAAEALDEARQAAAAARRLQPASTHVRALDEALAAAQAGRRAPDEAQLQGMLDARAPLEAIEAAAERIRAQWPDSEVAGRALRAAAARRRLMAADEARSRAEEAFAQGAWSRAATLYAEAEALGADVGARRRDAEARARAARGSEQVQRVLSALGARVDEAALLAWLELDAEARDVVAALLRGAAPPHFAWLADAPASGQRAKEAVRAALAMGQVRVDEAPERVVALLEPHMRTLPAAAAAVATARARVDAARRAEAVAFVAVAERAAAFAELDDADEAAARLRAFAGDDARRRRAFAAIVGERPAPRPEAAPAGLGDAAARWEGATAMARRARALEDVALRIERQEVLHASWLDGEQRRRLAAVCATLRGAVEYAELRRWLHLHHLRRNPELFRALAAQLGERPDEPARARSARWLEARQQVTRGLELTPHAHRLDWLEVDRDVEGELGTWFRALVLDGDEAAALRYDDAAAEIAAGEAAGWLNAGGDVALVPVSHGEWLFLRWVEVATGRVRRAVSLRLRGGAVCATLVEPERVALMTEYGDIVHLAPKGDLVVAWHPHALHDTRPVDDGLLLPGGRHAWFARARRGEARGALYVVETGRKRVAATHDAGVMAFLPDDGEGRVARVAADRGIALHAPSGRPLGPAAGARELAALGDVRNIAASPDGRGFVLLVRVDDGIAAFGLDEAGRGVPGPALRGASPQRTHAVATSRAHGCTFTVHRPMFGQYAEITALLPEAGELRAAWSQRVDERTALLTDAHGRHVAALCFEARGAAIAALRPDERPALRAIIGEVPWEAALAADAAARWRALERAELARARGDWSAVVGSLDAPAPWRHPRDQELGRLAEAWLERGPGTDADRFRARLALAALVRLADAPRGDIPPAPPIPANLAWSDARVAAVVERARAWLDAE